jgi:fatty acid desaturase
MSREVVTPLTQALSEGLIDHEDLRNFMKRSNSRPIIKIFFHLLVFTATTYLIKISLHTMWIVPAMFIHGICLVHLFSLQHECVHYTVFRTRWLNNIVGKICGYIGFIPHSFFRYEHCDHHTFTHLVGRDPELIELPNSFSKYLLYLSAIPYWKSQISTIIQLSFRKISADNKRFLPKVVQSSVIRESRLMLFVYVSIIILIIMTGWMIPIWYWILPSILAEPVMRFIRMTEHVGRPNVTEMRKNTRTTYVSFFWRFLCWNMNYHADHHYVPSAPYHQLPKLHQHLKEHMCVVKNGYWGAHKDIISHIAVSPKKDNNTPK